ncbi:MAG: hypothetical protein DIU78_002375 [Pseudomonadota bacterium]
MSIAARSRRRSVRAGVRYGLALIGVLGLLALPETARADADSCMELHASGQRERRAGQLRAASEKFMTCGSDESCPQQVRADCMDFYAEVERVQPTVIFSVVDQHGGDVTNVVKVYSGEELIVEGLDGRAVAVDPGQHTFRFELPWGETITSEALIREGEKNRVVLIRTVDPNKPATLEPMAEPAGPAPATPQAPPRKTEPPNRTPAGFWVATGVGIMAIGTGTVFSLLGRGTHQDLADCSPQCDPALKSDYESMKRNYLIGDIALGAGVLSLGVATVIYLTSGGSSRTETAATQAPRLKLTPVATREGASLVVSGTTF